MKNEKIIENFNIEKRNLELLFEEYIKKPFPEIINYTDEKVKEYIREIVVSKIIYKDIEIFGKINIENLTKILNIFLRNPGMILNIDNLSKDLSMGKSSIEKYLYILQFSK
ncbi:MAG: hypothetical protein ACP5G1_02700, partial [Nanopusillaceae archaeon]